MGLRILVVEDDPEIRREVGDALRDLGHNVTRAADGGEALNRLASTVFDLVVTDVRLPNASGLEIFEHARKESPTTEVILMTSYAAVSDAVKVVKSGAFDYLTKPFELDELTNRVKTIEERVSFRRELEAAREKLTSEDATTQLVGASPAMARLRERIAKIASSDAAVLITGESGTGKELVARTLHALSDRRTGPFVAVNCAAFPETLLEAELFGHEKGAFTGANKRREGRFQAASGGTLLLDEIGEMPPAAQAKLLRVLQEGRIEPLGTNESIKVDVRVVSATNRDLKKRIAEGLFREDLYYRLNAVSVAIPPLRERRSDLPMLLHHFLRRFVPAEQPIPEVSLRAWAALSSYSFPGNVREFAHAIQHAVVLSHGGTIELEHLPDDVVLSHSPAANDFDVKPLNMALKRFERDYLIRALASSGGRRAKAAEMLGISRKNLWEKLRAHGVSDADLDD